MLLLAPVNDEVDKEACSKTRSRIRDNRQLLLLLLFVASLLFGSFVMTNRVAACANTWAVGSF
jgi:hypothetical protein